MADAGCSYSRETSENLRSVVENVMVRNGIPWEEKSATCHRLKDPTAGDFAFPKGCLPELSDEVIHQILEEAEKKSKSWLMPLKRGVSTKYNHLAFHLDRSHAFFVILKDVLQRGNSYGVTPAHKEQILLNSVPLFGDNSNTLGLQHVRGILLTQHILRLLETNGYSVVCVQYILKDSITELLKTLRVDRRLYNAEQDGRHASVDELSKGLQNCEYQESARQRQRKTVSSERLPEECKLAVLNLSKFVKSDESLLQSGFDKNLHLVNVYDEEGPSEVFQQVALLDTALLTTKWSDFPVTCLHVAPCGASFTQQQVHLTWHMLSKNAQELHQTHLTFGPVTSRKKSVGFSDMDVKKYISLRHEQMKQASVSKYGEMVKGEGWEDMISSLTVACIKFELLSTVCRNPVKLDFSEKSPWEGVDNQTGSFVMYNCARLATLFHHFEVAVDKGIYPALPSIENINFDALKKENEWILLFNFVLQYPEMVSSTVPNLSPVAETIHVNIHTHKVTSFLVGLSHHLSSYYSKVHILGEPLDHLLPVMYARLYLLKSVHTVMQNAMHLLDIDPPTQL